MSRQDTSATFWRMLAAREQDTPQTAPESQPQPAQPAGGYQTRPMDSIPWDRYLPRHSRPALTGLDAAHERVATNQERRAYVQTGELPASFSQPGYWAGADTEQD